MNISPSSHIKTTVMRRVRFIWFMRRMLPFLIIETVAVAFVVRQLAESVFFNHVLQNAILHTFTRSPFMIVDFFFRAFLHTEGLVQILFLASLLVAVLLARDTLRIVRTFAMKQSNLSQFLRVV